MGTKECGQCDVIAETRSLEYGPEQCRLDVCKVCFEKEMVRRMTLNLAQQRYEYAIQSWNDPTGQGDALVSTLAKAVAAHMESVITEENTHRREELHQEIMAAVLPLLPPATGRYLLSLQLRFEVMFDMLGLFAARMQQYTDTPTILAELEEAYEYWEVEFGMILRTALAKVEGGKEHADVFLAELKQHTVSKLAGVMEE